MAKGSEPVTQRTTTELSPEQRELMQLALPGVREFAAGPPPARYPGSTVAGFDPAQVAGQGMALDAAGAQADLARGGADRANFFTSGDIWKPENNPALAGAVDAATRPITNAYERKVLPGIRGEAVTTGNFGGSRQGVAEGIASGEMLNAVGDTSAKLVNNAYDTNINAQLKALGLIPTLQNAQLAPAVTTSGVGDVRQSLEQAQLNADVAGFNYDQMAPFLQSKEILSLLTGLPGGSTVSTGNSPTPNKFSSALGSAASGAALGSAIFPGVGTAAGAGAGAILPFLLG
jgi:hypothetical protein